VWLKLYLRWRFLNFNMLCPPQNTHKLHAPFPNKFSRFDINSAMSIHFLWFTIYYSMHFISSTEIKYTHHTWIGGIYVVEDNLLYQGCSLVMATLRSFSRFVIKWYFVMPLLKI
jgi:hypothetical protein